MKNGIKIALIIICICIIIGGIIYGVITLNKKDKVIYITDNDYLYDIAKEYLMNQEKETSHDKDMPNFNSFIAYKGFGIQENSDKTEKYAYMWVLQENYYVLNNQLCSSTGSSMAYKFTFKDDKVVKYDIPEDGSRYTPSMKNMFPSDVYNRITSYDSSSSGELGKNIKEQLREYYKGIDVSQRNNILGTTFAGIIERNDTENKTIYVQGFKDNDINYKGEFILKISDKTNIGYNSQVLKQEELKRGDTIKILFTGSVLESYPGQIEEVLVITKFDTDKLILLDANHLSSGFVYEFSNEDKEKMDELLNKVDFENTTTNTDHTYTFKLNGDDFAIKMFGEIHIEKNKNQEANLTDEQKKELNNLLMKYVQHQ